MVQEGKNKNTLPRTHTATLHAEGERVENTLVSGTGYDDKGCVHAQTTLWLYHITPCTQHSLCIFICTGCGQNMEKHFQYEKAKKKGRKEKKKT